MDDRPTEFDEKVRHFELMKSMGNQNRLFEVQTEAMNKQTEILDQTKKMYSMLVFLTLITAIFIGFQTAIDNISWNYNPRLMTGLYTINLVLIPTTWGVVIYMAKKLSKLKKENLEKRRNAPTIDGVLR